MSDLADVVLAEAKLREFRASFHLCATHQPDRWEDDGTCPICEGQRLHERHAALVAALEVLVELLHVWQDDPQAGPDEARRLIGATEDALRDLVRQHRDERTPIAPEA